MEADTDRVEGSEDEQHAAAASLTTVKLRAGQDMATW